VFASYLGVGGQDVGPVHDYESTRRYLTVQTWKCRSTPSRILLSLVVQRGDARSAVDRVRIIDPNAINR